MPNGRRRKQPRGFGLYRFVHRVRHPGVVRLTAKGYRRDPWRAFRTALGLHPRGTVKAIRRRQAVHRMPRRR